MAYPLSRFCDKKCIYRRGRGGMGHPTQRGGGIPYIFPIAPIWTWCPCCGAIDGTLLQSRFTRDSDALNSLGIRACGRPHIGINCQDVAALEYISSGGNPGNNWQRRGRVRRCHRLCRAVVAEYLAEIGAATGAAAQSWQHQLSGLSKHGVWIIFPSCPLFA